MSSERLEKKDLTAGMWLTCEHDIRMADVALMEAIQQTNELLLDIRDALEAIAGKGGAEIPR